MTRTYVKQFLSSLALSALGFTLLYLSLNRG